MSRPRASVPDIEAFGAEWLADRDAAYVVLPRVHTRTEAQLVKRWVEACRAQGQRIALATDASSALRHARCGDAYVVPVAVGWSARRRPPSNSSRGLPSADQLLEYSLGVLPRQVSSWGQGKLVAARPDQTCLMVGAPARCSELEARWRARANRAEPVGTDVDGADLPLAELAGFVSRQADIAIERAERTLRGERYRRPRAGVDEVMTTREFSVAAAALAARLGRNPDSVAAEARGYLKEMATEQQRWAIDLWARLSRRLHGRAYHLDVLPADVARLRELAEAGNTLIILPSHRSNLDGYVLSTVTYENDLPPNHVLGGLNMAFWPLGTLGRRSGVIFIRRDIRDNEVYRFALKQYLAFLVARRFNLLWSIEGGRSRTGKLLPPKVGLLSYLADAVQASGKKDVLLVPVGIVFDYLNEARETTAESRGAQKQVESFRWLVRYARTQRGDLGSIYVRFGEPLNLGKEVMTRASGEGGRDRDSARIGLSKIAFEVCTRINRVTVATAPALVSFALLGEGDRALDLAEIHSVITPVLDYVEARDLPVTAETRALRDETALLRTLSAMTGHGVVETFSGEPHPVFRVGSEQALVAAFYRNATIHWFVNRAVAELAIVRAGDSDDPESARRTAYAEAFRLRDLLKFEFFFSDKAEFESEIEAEFALLRPPGGWAIRDESLWPGASAPQVMVAPRVLRSFIEAYWIVAGHLRDLGATPVDAKRLPPNCLGRGQQYLRQQRVRSEEAVSLHLFQTATKLAANRDLLAGHAALSARRQEFEAEVRAVLRRLDAIQAWDQARHRIDPGVTAARTDKGGVKR